MVRLRLLLLLALGPTALAGPVASAGAQNGAQDAAFARGISKALATHGLGGKGTGVAVADLATGQIIYRRNGWRAMLPASTEKLFTTVAAFTTLHPTFRFATTVSDRYYVMEHGRIAIGFANADLDANSMEKLHVRLGV